MKHFIKAVGHVSDRLCVAFLEPGIVSYDESVIKEIEVWWKTENCWQSPNEHHAGNLQILKHAHTHTCTAQH